MILCLFAAQLSPLAAAPATDALEDFNRPFLFSYLSWQDKALTTNGVAVLRGFNNQGGAGINGEWDLAGKADLVPALRLKVGPANQAGALILSLKDQGDGEGRWEFPLVASATNAGFVTVFSREQKMKKDERDRALFWGLTQRLVWNVLELAISIPDASPNLVR